jgi:HAD superfamily hydrolase (TIGR01484 family)
MLPLSRFPDDRAKRVRYVFTDLDDTLTTDGQLGPEAYAALWKLTQAGIQVVVVSGRPAGWCDHLARMWPVAGVIGENGALYYRYERTTRTLSRKYLLHPDERQLAQKKLARLEKQILKAVPAARVAADQAFRLHDLAIDFAEDVGPLPKADVARIAELFEKAGAVAKVSSIHVNGWFGAYDKITMIQKFAEEVWGQRFDNKRRREAALYVGDSPNDEPAFAFFENAVGVAGIRGFVDQMAHPPSYVTRGDGGAGFVQLAQKLIRARSAH